MNSLLTTGKDCSSNTVSPDLVDWSTVTRLVVMDMLDADNRPVLFSPCVVWKDDTWARLTDTFDIAAARQTCARLSAIHDKPVQDWTRPVPDAVPREGFMWDAAQAGFVPPERMNEVPDEAPEWGAGWYLTDWLFMDGATDAEFEKSLADMERDTFKAFAGEKEATPENIAAALAIQRSEARRRWVMLHAANVKPSPVGIA